MKNVALIFVSLVAVLLACSSSEMKKAEEYMAASMYEQAIQLLELEILENPKNAEASYLLGKCYLNLSRPELVKESFNRAILLNPKYREEVGDIYLNQAMEMFKREEHNQGYQYLNKGLEYNPLEKGQIAKQLYDYLDESLNSQSDISTSIGLYNVILQIEPTYRTRIAEKIYSLAISFFDRGLNDQGFEYANYSIELDPKHIKDVSQLYFKHANNQLNANLSFTTYSEYFNQCILLDPTRKNEIVNLLYNKAREYEKAENKAEMFLIAESVAQMNGDYSSWYTDLKNKYNQNALSDPFQFVDYRDNQTYNYVRIGTQTWMSENLNFQSYSDSWCYNDDSYYCRIYGRLYSWEIANTVCPTGWHLPSNREWQVLVDYLGGPYEASGKLKTIGTSADGRSHWAPPNDNATNSSGFSGEPGGSRLDNGGFGDLGDIGRWWSSTAKNSEEAYYWLLASYSDNNGAHIQAVANVKRGGMSVRCIKN